jgi:hypothetical protein
MRRQPRRLDLSPAPMQQKKSLDTPLTGYALIVDGHIKTEFPTKEGAHKGAKDLKRRFPMLQVKVLDAESKRREDVELT